MVILLSSSHPRRVVNIHPSILAEKARNVKYNVVLCSTWVLTTWARDPKYVDVFTKMSALLDERITDAAEPPEGIMQNHEQFERIGLN